jgi:site-specific DNA-methyltransferase (adenine-specific)
MVSLLIVKLVVVIIERKRTKIEKNDFLKLIYKNKKIIMSKNVKLMLGDNISSLKKLPDNSIDSVVSDPPYGLSFMGKKWDYDVPSVEFWREVYRVLKPGGHILSFGGTRTYHRMVVNIEDAGFEIRDQIMWLYGSGFPKSHNIGKAVDKLQGNEREVVGYIPQFPDGTRGATYRGQANTNNVTGGFTSKDTTTNGLKPVYKKNNDWEGWGTALKPANEPICVARKPLSEKSVALNVLKWGTGGINIDGCRVGSDKVKVAGHPYESFNRETKDHEGQERNMLNNKDEFNEGRFPANIILECLCDEVIKGEKGEVKRIKSDGGNTENRRFGNGKGLGPCETNAYNDKGDIHTNPMCPCYMLDEQSGVSKSNCKSGVVEGKEANVFNDGDKKTSGHKKLMMVGDYNDKGGASRFFYQAKVSKAERNMGLDGFDDKEKIGNLSDVVSDSKLKVKNNHPTVKPVNLMAYLCRLVTPPNGICLDPFMGSGATGIAAQLEGFRFVGMELDEDYFKIAEARIENFESYRKFIKK